jgi:hypothetical protein
MTHDWCAAQSNVADGTFFFTDWLDADACKFFEPGGGRLALRTDGSPTASAPPTSPDVDLALVSASPSAPTSPSPAPEAGHQPAVGVSADGWRLPLGRAYELRACSSSMPELAGGGFRLDFELEESGEQPAVKSKGLSQTYLIFGGPGAGKTYYFKYLLSSLLAHDRRPGCLLLDPKGALTGWLKATLDKIGRSGDLVVLDGATKVDEVAFNVLGDDLLPPNELGRLLSEIVLAGTPGVEDWGVLVSDLLQAAAVVLHARDGCLTAKGLLQAVLYRKEFDYGGGVKKKLRPIEVYAEHIVKTRSRYGPLVQIAADRLIEFFTTTEDRQRRFVRQIIEMALGDLTSPQWSFLSVPNASPPYSDIIHEGRVVSVAVGQSSPSFQRAMSSLVKALFQQAVLADLTKRTVTAAEHDREPTLRRDRQEDPFFILACDEYAQAITEGESGLVSDSRFFSLSREAGCLSLLALQSVATGRSRFPASMHDRWEGILGNVTVKMFMRLNDIETAELGSALAGTQHSFIPVVSQQQSAQGLSATEAVTMVEHRRVPPWYLTNRMEQGLALVHGTLDGVSVPTTMFVRAPSPAEQEQLRRERTGTAPSTPQPSTVTAKHERAMDLLQVQRAGR